jgi:hypothetical protein
MPSRRPPSETRSLARDDRHTRGDSATREESRAGARQEREQLGQTAGRVRAGDVPLTGELRGEIVRLMAQALVADLLAFPGANEGDGSVPPGTQPCIGGGDA